MRLTGIGADAPPPPRIHGLRHSFAVNTLIGWHRDGENIDARLPALSTYLGHRDPRSTYWYALTRSLVVLLSGTLRCLRPLPRQRTLAASPRVRSQVLGP